jgi:hypothetical protein
MTAPCQAVEELGDDVRHVRILPGSALILCGSSGEAPAVR